MKINEEMKQRISRNQPKEQECLHDKCPKCKGTGRKKDGSICIHMISCPCRKCNPFSF